MYNQQNYDEEEYKNFRSEIQKSGIESLGHFFTVVNMTRFQPKRNVCNTEDASSSSCGSEEDMLEKVSEEDEPIPVMNEFFDQQLTNHATYQGNWSKEKFGLF